MAAWRQTFWILCAWLCSSAPAQAWVLSEHSVLTDRAVDRLPLGARDALERALAASAGVCATLDERFDSISAGNRRPGCVPYAALPGIAGDHSAIPTGHAKGHQQAAANTAFASLSRVVRSIGPRLVRTARSSWLDAQALSADQRADDSERITVARDLDIALALRQSGYTQLATRSGSTHFMPAGDPIAKVIGAMHAGHIDNALAQFLLRHLRALQFAVRARADTDSDAKLKEALFEHAYSLHFLQDVFAAGHLVAADETRRFERMGPHNFYSRHGLPITFAGRDVACHLEQPRGEPECWTTRGDYYLSIREDDWGSRKAALAQARAQLYFAIAIDPGWFERERDASDADAPLRRARLQRLLLGVPQFTPLLTLPAGHSDADAQRDMQRVLDALAGLCALDLGERVQAGGMVAPFSSIERPAGETPKSVLALARQVPRDVLEREQEGVGVLARAALQAWPVPQARTGHWSGTDALYQGLAFQLRAGGLGLHAPQERGDSLRGFGVHASVGLSYRVVGLVPGFANRPFAELNAGLLYLRPTDFPTDNAQGSRGAEMSPLWRFELRVPIIWLGILTLANSITHNLAGVHVESSASTFEFIGGASLALDGDGRPRIWDLELFAIRVGNRHILEGDTREIFIPVQFDLHLGWWRPAIDHAAHMADWDIFLGLGISGGYAHML